MGEKRTRVSLTALKKKEICKRASNANVQQKALEKEYGISPQQEFQTFLRTEINGYPWTAKIWVDNILSRDELNLSDGVLIEEAREFAIEFGISDRFLASTGWAKNFKRRNNLRSYKKRGQAR